MKVLVLTVFVLFSTNSFAAPILRDFNGVYKLAKLTNRTQSRFCKSALKIQVDGDDYSVYFREQQDSLQGKGNIKKTITYKDDGRETSVTNFIDQTLAYRISIYKVGNLNPKVVYSPRSSKSGRIFLTRDGQGLYTDFAWNLPYKNGTVDVQTYYCEYRRLSH